jgi:hypothetical protein
MNDRRNGVERGCFRAETLSNLFKIYLKKEAHFSATFILHLL